MKIKDLVGSTARLMAGMKFRRNPRLGGLDMGILKVSLMVAALDGTMQPSEIETFRTLAKKCRGYSAPAAREAFASALRSAGYLLLLAQTSDERKLLGAFVDEALLAMPNGFLNGDMEDIRRAFVFWTAMAMGDGEYSPVERKAVAALRKTWCDMRTAMISAETEMWLATGPRFHLANGGASGNRTIRLIPDDFLDRAEAALTKFDEAAITGLILNG